MLKKIIYTAILLSGMLFATTVNTDKDIYTPDESIVVNYGDLQGQGEDEWIAIYPKGSSNDFGNIVQWKATDGNANGTLSFNPRNIGSYEVRVFNHYDFLISKEITVSEVVAADPTVNTNQNRYTSDEQIVVSYENLQGNGEDEWMAIYPQGSSNDFGNILQWKPTDGNANGTVTFDARNVGNYEVRVFNHANFLVSKQFNVNDDAILPTVETTKNSYLADEEIVAVFENIAGEQDNWIGIYPQGSSNEWANAVQWEYIENGLHDGTQTFNAIPAGEYEVRVFLNNTFNTEASYAFSVEALPLSLSARKNIFDPYELIHIDFQNMRGDNGDWIGLFAVGAGDAKENAIEWRDSKSLVNGELSFNGLAAGSYEARAYFDAAHQKTVTFTVQAQPINRVLYDDFEDGIDPRWSVYYGKAMTLLNVGVPDGGAANTERKVFVNGQHSLRTYNSDGLPQSSGYIFDFQNPDPKLKFLEVDVKIGVSSHRFAFGVNLRTTKGNRRIEFASWLNHRLPGGIQIIRGPYGNVLEGHREAFTQDNYLFVHPGPSDYYVGTSGVGGGSNMFVHYKINIEEKLRVMEPDNELLGITAFTTSGGDYDNLALISQ